MKKQIKAHGGHLCIFWQRDCLRTRKATKQCAHNVCLLLAACETSTTDINVTSVQRDGQWVCLATFPLIGQTGVG